MDLGRMLRLLRLGFAFLTVWPVGPGEPLPEADLAAARFAFPAVGLLLGLALACLNALLLRLGAPTMLAAFLLVAAGAIVSGGLHLDGLADTADGLFLGGDVTRRLEVMRDPHAGSFGVIALVLVLLGKFAALASLGGHTRTLAILAAVAISRALILVSAGLAPYARPEGTGRILIGATTRDDTTWSALLVVVLGLFLGRAPGLLAAVAALGLAWGLTQLARQRLGGVTGDILGALVELGELVVLVVLGNLQSLWLG